MNRIWPQALFVQEHFELIAEAHVNIVESDVGTESGQLPQEYHSVLFSILAH